MVAVMERELFRAKEENFQDLLDYKKSIKEKLSGGCTTVRHDYSTGEYVLVHTDKSWGTCITENAIQMTKLMEDFEDYLMKEEEI